MKHNASPVALHVARCVLKHTLQIRAVERFAFFGFGSCSNAGQMTTNQSSKTAIKLIPFTVCFCHHFPPLLQIETRNRYWFLCMCFASQNALYYPQNAYRSITVLHFAIRITHWTLRNASAKLFCKTQDTFCNTLRKYKLCCNSFATKCIMISYDAKRSAA